MRKITLFILTIASTGFIVPSCSKCYECTTEHEVEVISTDTSYTTVETSSEDYCTTDDKEIEQIEDDQGATCIVI
jgi:hypothetical protein